jgi:disulfide bond formation protein DsbB
MKLHGLDWRHFLAWGRPQTLGMSLAYWLLLWTLALVAWLTLGTMVTE